MKVPYRFNPRTFVLGAVLVAGLSSFMPAFGQQYTGSYIFDPDSRELTQVGGEGTIATGINDIGQVIGTAISHNGFSYDGFITGPNGTGMTFLGLFYDASVNGVNDAGQVVGEERYAGDSSVAFLTRAGGFTYNVGKLSGSQGAGWFTSATDINNSGHIVGWSSTYGPARIHAFITDSNGNNSSDLGTLLGGYESFANSINEAGQVVGYSGTFEHSHAFITGANGVGMRDLGSLGGPGSSSFATGINDAGQVVGYFETASGDSHAFITGPNGENMTDLGTLGEPGSSSFATGINNEGQVVGYFEVLGGTHAFVTGPNGQDMIDLNSAVKLPDGVFLKEAPGINNLGQVVAVAVIPEPASYALMLAGLALIGFMLCRQHFGQCVLYST